jgi:hypothetical protein
MEKKKKPRPSQAGDHASPLLTAVQRAAPVLGLASGLLWPGLSHTLAAVTGSSWLLYIVLWRGVLQHPQCPKRLHYGLLHGHYRAAKLLTSTAFECLNPLTPRHAHPATVKKKRN